MGNWEVKTSLFRDPMVELSKLRPRDLRNRPRAESMDAAAIREWKESEMIGLFLRVFSIGFYYVYYTQMAVIACGIQLV